jgi:hypothetical protein
MSIRTKIAASSVNCATAIAVALPIAPLTENWRYMAVAVFFLIQQRDRCPGMVLTGQQWGERPGSLAYSLLYTASFATLFWYVLFPLDVALLNGAGQLACLYYTGNTIHGHLTGVRAMNEQEKMIDHVMRGLCPACEARTSMRSTGFGDRFKCEKCESVFDCGPSGVFPVSV